MDIPRDYDPTPWRESTPGIGQIRPPQRDKDYARIVASLREIDSLLPEGSPPWEVAQIALEFADHINIADGHQGFLWRLRVEHEKAEEFVDFLKHVYGKHQSIPLDEEDH